MSPKSRCCAALFFCIFSPHQSFAVILTSGQTDYTTSSDITTSSFGITSSLSGSSSALNKITNTYTITTGNNGATSGAYGIRTTGSYNQITNSSTGAIITTGSSGRGISIAGNSVVYNLGAITTSGTTSYGIYAGSGNDTISNSGSIVTSNSSSYGIYLASDNNSASNSGSINTQVYGIYSDGNVNQISNSGTITTTSGSSAHGIFVSAGSASTASALSHVSITNSGTINSNANGIYNKDNYSEISNSGTIQTATGSTIYGIRNEGDDVVIDNSGNISASNYAIFNFGDGTIINNSGVLNGGVAVGPGTLNILGGSINGVVDGASGSGIVNVGSVLHSAVTFNQTAAFSNLSSLTISDASTLNSGAAISVANIFIADNSVLNLNSGSSVNAAIQGSSASSGIINIAADISVSGAIGGINNSLANLNVFSGGSLTASTNIYADEISLSGTLNFADADNLIITGNLVGSSSGVINVGDKNQSINGNFSLSDGDQLAVSLKNNGAGSLAVSGLATITSGVKIAVTTSENQGYIPNGTQYQILSTPGNAVIGEIAEENILVDGVNSNVAGLLKYSVNSSADGLILDVNHVEAAQVTPNINAQNIYQNLVDIGALSSGKLLQFQTYLDNSKLSGDQLTQAINQLAPQSTKAELTTLNNVVGNTLSISENHLEKRRRDENLVGEGSWGQIFGGSEMQDQVASDDGYKANFAGISFGWDKEISDTTLLGAAASVAKSSLKSLDAAKQNLIDTYQINFYASKNFDQYFIDAIGAVALSHFDSTRSINALGLSAVAGYLGQTYGLKIKSGVVKKLRNGFSVVPEASLNFLRNNIAAYNEKGAEELNLDVSGVTANFLEARLGIGLDFSSRVTELPEFRKVAALLKISYGYSVINDAPTTTASFQGQSLKFESQITNVDRASLKLGAEFMAYQKDDATFSIDYSFERKATYSSHFAIFKVRQEF